MGLSLLNPLAVDKRLNTRSCVLVVISSESIYALHSGFDAFVSKHINAFILPPVFKVRALHIP
jgi:hypothetical protein